MFTTHTSMKIGYNLVWSHLDRPHRLPMTRGVNRPRRINQTFKSHQMNIKHQCHQKHQHHHKQVERDPHFSSNISNASSFYRNLTESLSVQIHNEKQGYNAEKRRGEKEEKKAQKSSMEETGRCYLDQLPPPPNPTQGQPANLPGCHHWFQSTVQALRVCSTFYQVFLLFWKHHWFKPPLLFKACCTFLPLHLGHWIQ